MIALLPLRRDRIHGRIYKNGNHYVRWSGKRTNKWCIIHNKIFRNCLKCNVSMRCPHTIGRHKRKCIICTPSIECIHRPGKLKSTCVKCRPSNECIHRPGSLKKDCIRCSPSMACPHYPNKRKSNCFKCTPSNECPHIRGRLKFKCIKCTPSIECVHRPGRLKANCIKCKPSSFCSCGVLIQNCPKCCNQEFLYNRFCVLCGKHRVKRSRRSGVCAKCDPDMPIRLEHVVKNYIFPKLPPTSADDNIITGISCSESRRRADAAWVLEDRIVQLEIDENNGHSGREVSCELSKMDSSKWGLHPDDQFKTMIFIRFNPTTDTDEELNIRCEVLVKNVLKYLSCDIDNSLKITVVYLFYPSNNKHLAAAKNKKEYFNVVVN